MPRSSRRQNFLSGWRGIGDALGMRLARFGPIKLHEKLWRRHRRRGWRYTFLALERYDGYDM